VAIALVLAAGAALVLLGCRQDTRPVGPPAPWYVPGWVSDRPYSVRPDAKSIFIAIDPNHCWLDDESPVDRIEVDETTRTVTITAHVERSQSENDCKSIHEERIQLEAPLGDRTLIVGGDEPQEAFIETRSNRYPDR
jgi:hypothetical protein